MARRPIIRFNGYRMAVLGWDIEDGVGVMLKLQHQFFRLFCIGEAFYDTTQALPGETFCWRER